MSWYGLADFLEALGQAGDLIPVAPEVEPALEVAEIVERIGRTGGAALLFSVVRGCSIPVVANLLGSEDRIRRVLGLASLEDLTGRIAELVRPASPEGWLERIGAAPARGPLKRLLPHIVKSAVCQQVVRLGSDVDLLGLPALQSRPLEAGRTITAGQVVSASAGSAKLALGRHDLCVLDRDRLAIAWLPHDEHARLVAEYRRRGEPMPVAIMLGGHPAALLAAMAPLPPDSDRFAFAGLLRNKPLELVGCRTLELSVGADAEIILEGTVDPDEAHATGLLAAPGGFYQASRPASVMRVTAMTHRANPIFPAMVPGYPGDEACVIASVLHRCLLPLVQCQLPELVNYHFPPAAASRYCGVVSIQKAYAGQARKVACALWGMSSLMLVKLWVVVDDGVDVADPGEVWASISAHVDPGRDVFCQQGPPDPLDPAGEAVLLGSRMVIDATAKLPGESSREAPARAEMTDEIRRLVSSRWSEYGFRGS